MREIFERLKAAAGPNGFTEDAREIAPHLEEWRGRTHGKVAADRVRYVAVVAVGKVGEQKRALDRIRIDLLDRLAVAHSHGYDQIGVVHELA